MYIYIYNISCINILIYSRSSSQIPSANVHESLTKLEPPRSGNQAWEVEDEKTHICPGEVEKSVDQWMACDNSHGGYHIGGPPLEAPKRHR